MRVLKEIGGLISKELILEWRQAYAINSILLYLGSVVFICYLSIGIGNNQLNPIIWNALYWIILLFVAVNGVAKSFMLEGKGRMLYYYSLVSPVAVIISKIVYNSFLTILLALLGLAAYSFIMSNPVQDMQLFIINILLASLGFAGVLTLTSGIAAKARNSATIMSILSFPVIIPVLLMAIKISKNAMDGLDVSVSTKPLMTLGAIDVLIVMTAIILFPYLWRS